MGALIHFFLRAYGSRLSDDCEHIVDRGNAFAGDFLGEEAKQTGRNAGVFALTLKPKCAAPQFLPEWTSSRVSAPSALGLALRTSEPLGPARVGYSVIQSVESVRREAERGH